MAGTSRQDAQAIKRLKRAVANGTNWYVALLEAIRLWGSFQEYRDGRHYRYVIDDEALNWLVLAERLCEELDGLIPEQERTELLFFNRPPVQLSKGEFKDLVGELKYKAHLNYFYGVLVERFLVLAVVEEIRKSRRVLGLTDDNGVVEQAYQRLYGSTQLELLKRFRKERGYRQLRSIGLAELDEFTYWLFKYRIRTHDKACVASDTKKALAKLQELLAVTGRLVCSPGIAD